jgi:PiT family inorganic phosphate transporter
MDVSVLFFLSSGLFLGWSLGVNDAANVFGTAVGTRMVRFTTAAVVCSVFIVLGAVISGAGASHTLGELGSVNTLAGAFMVALSAGLTVYVMNKRSLSVSTSQAIVGAIIGWNLFSGSATDTGTLAKIFGSWVASPILAGSIAVVLHKLVEVFMHRVKLHLLRLDAYTRIGLIIAGAFGAYSLGANNIANVMGVFVAESPFTDFRVSDAAVFTSTQQLFLLGAVAVGVGVFTNSNRVMLTVGRRLLPMSPVAAWVAVVAHSIVLFAFASQGLKQLLAGAGLPTLPLVPVSSSQAIIGAVVGIGLVRGGREIRWRLLRNIGIGWVTTPILSAAVCFVALFFLQNVFNQRVYREVHYQLSAPAFEKLSAAGAPVAPLADLVNKEFSSSKLFLGALKAKSALSPTTQRELLYYGEIGDVYVDPKKIRSLDTRWLTPAQLEAIGSLFGDTFKFKWQFAEALARASDAWRPRGDTKLDRLYNEDLRRKLEYVYRILSANE